ncbi:MerR family transcriptional regulator [Candidatus Falkowbacteria bacterium]|nr:MerR family transcriptional regulator [Candidatus Falkowbacteria bacterium]
MNNKFYTIKQLATLAGVSVRTLHYYDQIGLLRPDHLKKNRYRQYGEHDLLELQQIMFFRELDFPLEEIKEIIRSPDFDLISALLEQKKLILIKKKRFGELAKTIDLTINKINKEKNMQDKDLYEAFSEEEGQKYAAEAKERWGNAAAYKQSQERVKKMSKEDWQRISKENEELMSLLVANMDNGVGSQEVQELIARHYEGLRHFYEPTLKMYGGLGEMYVSDPRFTAYYEKYAKGLAIFMRDAIAIFCKRKNKTLI